MGKTDAFWNVSKEFKLNIPALFLVTEKHFQKTITVSAALHFVVWQELRNWHRRWVRIQIFTQLSLHYVVRQAETTASAENKISFSLSSPVLRRHFLLVLRLGVFYAINPWNQRAELWELAEEIWRVIHRILSRNRLASPRRKNSYKHHTFLWGVMNL